jgi:uncharacterized protein YdiU (UPF0061 family)
MSESRSPVFDNSFARLSGPFYTAQAPSSVPNPGLIRINAALAEQLNISPDWLASAEGIATMAGNHVPDGAQSLAAVYAGHQFGGWNPQLGDGRAVLLGELIGTDGVLMTGSLKVQGARPIRAAATVNRRWGRYFVNIFCVKPWRLWVYLPREP